MGGGGGGGTPRVLRQTNMEVPEAINSTSTTQRSLTISCWNCRGWATGAAYLDHLVQGGSDVIVLSEHWLWPYELHKLDEFNSEYQGLGKADPRLTDTSLTCPRGCGGVGILWKKSFDVTPISDIQSDRICGIRIKRTTGDSKSWISILGVYLPCLDQGMELYRDSLVELERMVVELGVVGSCDCDFNAHLGPTWGSRAHKNSNIQGALLGEVLDRCKLHAVSLGALTTPIIQPKDPNWIRIHWAKAGKSEAMLNFQREVSNRLKPYIKRSRGNVDHIGQEIRHVAWLVNDAAQKTLPPLKPRRANGFRDKTLSQLCIRSKEAWRAWCREGRSVSGPSYDAKCALRREVRQWVKFCSAMEERKRVQRQESLFRSNSHLRFCTPQSRSKSKCTRLRVNGTLLSDPSLLLQAWTQHFQSLAKSQEETNPALKESIEQSKTLLSTTFLKDEVFLDVAFTTEKVEAAVKVNKSAEPDNLMAEHVKYGGKLIITWLTEILNAIVDAEEIPSCLKRGITVPVYKGGGKDPLNVNSYRGITINSVISKVLETLILN